MGRLSARTGAAGSARRLLAGLAALAAIVLGSLLTASPVSAADPVFGQARATTTFGVAIDLEQPFTVTEPVHRVEALVRPGPSARTFLETIPTPAAGASTLRYSYETPFGSLYPNTVVELGFRITLGDGRILDSPTTRVRYEDTRFAWQTLQGEIVRVHWAQGDEAFGRRALAIGERAVEESTTLLGVTESEPIDFFVYGDRDAFYDILGPAQRENVGGIALAEIRTLFANIEPAAVDDAWVGVVIPHELAHLVFDTATRNPYHDPPHWLNEGLADYLAQGYGAGARATVENAARSGELMPLRALVGRFPTTAARFSLAYDESVSAIDYLIRTHGQDALVQLVRSYADGVSDDAAFTAALGRDVLAFEAGWLADLGVQEPPAYGPRPAPAGPLPPGWVEGPAPTGAPGATVRPVASPRTGPPGTDDLAGPIILGVGAVLVVLVLAGVVVVARGLSRGDPLLPSQSPPDVEDEAGDGPAGGGPAAEDADADPWDGEDGPWITDDDRPDVEDRLLPRPPEERA